MGPLPSFLIYFFLKILRFCATRHEAEGTRWAMELSIFVWRTVSCRTAYGVRMFLARNWGVMITAHRNIIYIDMIYVHTVYVYINWGVMITAHRNIIYIDMIYVHTVYVYIKCMYIYIYTFCNIGRLMYMYIQRDHTLIILPWNLWKKKQKDATSLSQLLVWLSGRWNPFIETEYQHSSYSIWLENSAVDGSEIR